MLGFSPLSSGPLGSTGAASSSVDGFRITEASDSRILENGDTRVTENFSIVQTISQSSDAVVVTK